METSRVTKSVENMGFIKSFRQEAQANPLFMMVMKKFAERLRNRNTLTPAALKLALSKDDLNYPKGRYSDILKFMAKQGVGHLELGPRGRIEALNRIQVNLRELGVAVLAEQPIEVPPEINEMPKIPKQVSYEVQLLIGVDIKMPGVQNLSPDDLSDFISKFFRLCQRYGK